MQCSQKLKSGQIMGTNKSLNTEGLQPWYINLDLKKVQENWSIATK